MNKKRCAFLFVILVFSVIIIAGISETEDVSAQTDTGDIMDTMNSAIDQFAGLIEPVAKAVLGEKTEEGEDLFLKFLLSEILSIPKLKLLSQPHRKSPSHLHTTNGVFNNRKR